MIKPQTSNPELRAARKSGFTLIELAVVVAVVGLLLGGLLVPLATQFNLQRVKSTQELMGDVRDAVIGYALVNGRLPCPDNGGDGVEDRLLVAGPNGCVGGVYEGFVPWVTLGVPQTDVWGSRFRYRVTNEFTRATGDVNANVVACGPVPNTCTLELGDAGTINVSTRALATKALQAVAPAAPVVIVSHGPNAFGGTDTQGVARPAPPAANVDEVTNQDGLPNFVDRTPTRGATGCSGPPVGAPEPPFCQFDDLVTWVSANVLFHRLVLVGALP